MADIATPGGEGAEKAPQRTVLIIDDDVRVLASCRQLLEYSGHRVMVAHDPGGGIQLFRLYYGEIDVVILDWILPTTTGDVLLEHILEINPHTRVIFFTGMSLDEETYARVAPKVRGFLYKPFTGMSLIAAVDDAMADDTDN